MSSGRPRTFRDQRRPMEDCSRGRKEMTQEGRTRGGTLQSESDRCRESQGWTTACSGMTNVTGRTKKRIACSKRVHDGSLAITD